MTKKKSLLVFLCIFGLSTIVFSQFLGHGGQNGNSTAARQDGIAAKQNGSDSKDGEATIKASVAMEPKEFELFSRMARLYSDLHDDITIQVENVPAKDAYDKWKKAGQIGEAPDLMLLDNNWVQEFAALGFLQPVGEFFSSDQQNTRISTLMNQVKWNGYIWGVPKDVDPYILAWNQKTAAKLKLDGEPDDAQKLVAWNKAATKLEESQYGVYFDPTDPYAFIAVTSSLTGAWLSTDKVWTDEASSQTKLEAFLAPQEESWTGKAYPKNFPKPAAEWSAWEQLAKGKIVAMVTTVSAFKSNANGDIAMASIPKFSSADHAVWLKGRSFAISSRSQHAAKLMDWIKEMTASETELKYWTESRMLPVQISTYSMSPLRGDEHIQSYTWLVNQGRVLPVASETPKNISVIRTELNKLWKGESTVKQFMEQTGKLWTSSVKK